MPSSPNMYHEDINPPDANVRNEQMAPSNSRLPFEGGDHAFLLPPIRRPRISERDKRTYRACIACRSRKSRCDLYGSGEPGRPPCERCIREGRECILGDSRRGGKRIKRTLAGPEQPSSENAGPATTSSSEDVPPAVNPPLQRDEVLRTPEETQHRRLPSWPRYNHEGRYDASATQDAPTSQPSTKMTVDESIASTNLQNPSDALEFLAHVADRAEGVQLPAIRSSAYSLSPHQSGAEKPTQRSTPSTVMQSPSSQDIQYPPYQKGHVTLGMMRALLDRYRQKYHPFFAVVGPNMLEFSNLPANSSKEPHLLAAICAVASRDEPSWWQIHEACSTHMQELIANLMYGGEATIGAVEGLLILTEWVPRPPQSMAAVGRGEEEQTAWMLSGMAIRMGYLLGLDRTGFANESDPNAPDHFRRRLAWVGCYMSDRHISVRIGKAFWSRGPAMVKFTTADFAGLRSPVDSVDYAALCEANMELTQLFSNAHDVLYSSKNRSAQLNFGGEYVKYIDDFREAMTSWYDSWGGLHLTPALRAGIMLSYEYLRLYVNAFAYQATLSRMAQQHSRPQTSDKAPRPPGQKVFTDFIAATPDARFIYDSIDAAKKLLSIFNAYLDPTDEFRYMPLRYFLYVIYSAVFLYKARSTGVLGSDGANVKRTVNETMERLQKASSCQNDIGDRYSRLLRLLWRKPPTQTSGYVSGNETDAAAGNGARPPIGADQQQMNFEQTSGPSINAFSWLDLHAVGDFATNNNHSAHSASGSLMDPYENFDDVTGEATFGHFDPSFIQDQQQQQLPPLGWHGYPAPGVIF